MRTKAKTKTMTNVPSSAQSVVPNLKALLVGRTIKTHIRMIPGRVLTVMKEKEATVLDGNLVPF